MKQVKHNNLPFCFLASGAPLLGGSADGAKGIFGLYWVRVGCGPVFGPTLKKDLVPYLSPHHNRGFSMLYSWCDTGGCSSFTNSLPLADCSQGQPEGSLFDS